MDTSQLGYTLIHEHAVTCCDWSMRMCLRGQFCQEDRLLEHLSAEGNLRFVLGRVYDPAAARALLDRLGLPDTGAQPVREFSGGMKRRLALARALLAPFDALALDEPFTGLDRENRDLALACIRETAGDRPVLLVTHDAADAAGSPVVTL